MHLFRIRLILALIASVTLVSIASTYFDVLAHKHSLRVELERRTRWMGVSLEPNLERMLAGEDLSGLAALVDRSRVSTGALGLAVYDAQENLLACSGRQDVLQALPAEVVAKSIRKGAEVSAFGHSGDGQWLEEALPLHDGDKLEGSMAIVADAGYIRSEGIAVWQRSFLADCRACGSDRGGDAGHGELVPVASHDAGSGADAPVAAENGFHGRVGGAGCGLA